MAAALRRSPAGRSVGRPPGAVLGCLLLASCATITTLAEGDFPPPLSAAEAALAASGPQTYSVLTGRIEGAHGRPVAYETYLPEAPRTGVMVFLAHGFMRDLASMRGWAALWASHGVPVTVMSLRNSTWFNGRHDRNAADLRLLARTLHPGPVLFAGFSAGGLAALLAAADDGGPPGQALAYLGLDAVDSGGLAAAKRSALSVPALFLLAEPSACNARGNILKAVPDRAGVKVQRVPHATHCHFENPTDAACEALCGKLAPPEAADAVVTRIRSLATAWVLEQAGLEPGERGDQGGAAESGR